MAEEIQIPLQLWPQRTNNANATWDQLTQTNNNHQAAGWRFKDGDTADINGKIAQPIPSDINGTPAGKIRIHWVCGAATANDCKWFVYCSDIAYNTDSTDPSTWDDSLTVVDTNSGQYVENECEVSIATASLTAGKGLRVLIRRNTGDGQDTLSEDVILTDALFIADKT